VFGLAGALRMLAGYSIEALYEELGALEETADEEMEAAAGEAPELNDFGEASSRVLENFVRYFLESWEAIRQQAGALFDESDDTLDYVLSWVTALYFQNLSALNAEEGSMLKASAAVSKQERLERQAVAGHLISGAEFSGVAGTFGLDNSEIYDILDVDAILEDCASGTFDAEAFLEANPALNNAVVAPLSAALERLADGGAVMQTQGASAQGTQAQSSADGGFWSNVWDFIQNGIEFISSCGECWSSGGTPTPGGGTTQPGGGGGGGGSGGGSSSITLIKASTIISNTNTTGVNLSSPTFTSHSGTVTWSSSNPAVAIVGSSSGVVTPVSGATGGAVITATAGATSVEIHVTIYKPITVPAKTLASACNRYYCTQVQNCTHCKPGSSYESYDAGTGINVKGAVGTLYVGTKTGTSDDTVLMQMGNFIPFIWPLVNSSVKSSNFTITSNYGFRIYDGKEKTHKGIDISAAEGTSAVAIEAGTVSTGFDTYMGRYVRISHQNGYVSHYQHLKEGTQKSNGSVEQGVEIAKSGDTGSPGSFHLHLNLYKGSVSDSNLINPLEGYNYDDVRKLRKQRVPNPFYKTSGSAYVFNTSYTLTARDAYWNGNDTLEAHMDKTKNLYSRHNTTNPIADAYPNIHD
jgi:hypothetical protein